MLALVGAAGVAACHDDTDDIFGSYLQDGDETEVTLTFDFMPAADVNLTRQGTPGNTMSDLDDLCVLLFDSEGNRTDIRNIDLTVNQPVDKDRKSEDTSNGELDMAVGETKTKRVTAVIKGVKAGTYYIFAAANLGGKNGQESTFNCLEDVETVEEFKKLRMAWDKKNVANNNEMSGYFTTVSSSEETGSKVETLSYLDVKPVTINRSNMALHCWLRRLAAKVTVDFDASGLLPSTYVYIKKVRVRDLAYDCALMSANTVDDKLIAARDKPGSLLGENADGSDCQKIDFTIRGEDDTDYDKDYDEWPCLTSGNSSFKKLSKTEGFEYLEKYDHSNSAPSLFYYENMQGDTDSKLQDSDNDGTIDGKFKDSKPAGTFVEVVGYYKSWATGNEGEGRIVYRFMLGKDVKKNCDAERNYHLRLTLCLKGRANEADWHIEYDNDYPPFSSPNPYYISYGYNQSMELPLVFREELVGDIKLQIVRNDWRPYELWNEVLAPPTQYSPHGMNNTYYGPDENYTVTSTLTDAAGEYTVPEGPFPNGCAGFLSLRQPRYDAIGRHFKKMGDANDYMRKYWEGNGEPWAKYGTGTVNGEEVEYAQNEHVGRPLYERTYSPDPATDQNTGDHDGTYRVEHDKTHANKATYYIPLYTRERNLIKVSGFSGMNPYEGYQRHATVRATFTLKDNNGNTTKYEEDIQIIQVARVVNPTAVWRDWNVAREFKVDLMLKDGQNSTGFHTLQSRGGWSAEVEKGGDWLMLNGSHQKVYGATGTDISFTLKPKGILASKNSVPRFAIVHVRYHNYTCSHRIFVRQGYAPAAVTNGGVLWHTANLVTADKEASSPCDEGSMFKYGSFKHPIDASENGWYRKPWQPWNEYLEYFFDSDGNREFKIAGQTTKKKFEDIDKVIPEASTSYPENSLGRVPTPQEFAQLRDAPSVRFAYGVMYDDNAGECQDLNEEVYGYLGSDPSTHSYGMRGIIAYNELTGAQVFFPIGRAGHGRRCCKGSTYRDKQFLINNPNGYGWSSRPYTGIGVLRYASGRVTYFKDTEAPNTPMFWDKFYREGATYWLNNRTEITIEGEKRPACSIDINYFTFDFNTLNEEVFNTPDTDAMFLRLVSNPPQPR